jgi:hypothetical protein
MTNRFNPTGNPNWRYFPINDKKIPLIEAWQHNASSDPARLEAWKKQFPGCSWGIVCDDITVLDVDVKNENGVATLEALEQKHGLLPTTLTTQTKSGGFHHYFNLVPGLRNKVAFAPGLDIRTRSDDGKCGYVVAYKPTIDAPLADMPQWLIDVIKAGKPAILDARQGKKIPRGEWHSALVSQAGKLRNMNLSVAVIENTLLDFARNNFADQNIDVAHVKQIAADTAKWEAAPKADPETRSLITPTASWLPRKIQRWFWKPVMHHGAMLNFSGESSQGKSPITVDWAARLSRMTPGTRGEAVWPDGQPIVGGPFATIMMNNEDDLQDTILPRFDVAGGYDMFLHPVTGVQVSKDDTHHQKMIALAEDIKLICDLAWKITNLGMIVLDPITRFLGKLNMNREEEVSLALMPLVMLAQELGVVVVIVSHLNKSDSPDPMLRVMGARAFAGVARDAWQCSDDPDSESPYAHIMAPIRGPKASQSLKYHTEVVPFEIDGEMGEVIKIVWDGTSNATATQGLDKESKKNLSQDKEAAIELRNFLKAGKRSAGECQAFLKSCGFRVEDMNFGRVRKYAGVHHKQEGGGKNTKSFWFLPTAENMFEKSEARAKDDAPQY